MSTGITAADIMNIDLTRAKKNGWLDEEWAGCFVTDPRHGGKVTCHKCNDFIQEKDLFQANKFLFNKQFHKDCFNPYEHYYGLDRPID